MTDTINKRKKCNSRFDSLIQIREIGSSKRSTHVLGFNFNKKMANSKRSTHILTSDIKTNLLKSKRSQEEMVGFVLIIVLVSVIALVFLAISLRKPARTIESLEIKNFLHSVLMFTTSCQETRESFLDFKDLIGVCYKKGKCLDEKEACNVLNETSIGLVENGFSVERHKGYVFKIYDRKNETLLYLKKGNETSIKYGSEVYFYSYEADDKVYVMLRLFY